jgi:endonuclease YncB( thermonuclease family)
MPFKIIRGTYHVQGYSPDGDSVRFQPVNADAVRGLSGPPARINGRGHVQLRIEAIDALETHFSPPGGNGALHQPLGLAHEATDLLLDFLGIRNVQWNAEHRLVVSADDGTAGYILSKAVEKNGRPVAFVFRGDPPGNDGDDIRVEPGDLHNSYNHLALERGLAYPTYYKGLFADLREELTRVAVAARQSGKGIWAEDRTGGVDVPNLQAITDEHPILPKLFRRLSEYMVNFGSVRGFKDKLEQSREPVLDLVTQNFTHFDTFIEEQGDRIALTRGPEQLVFDEMPMRPTHAFSALMSGGPAAV